MHSLYHSNFSPETFDKNMSWSSSFYMMAPGKGNTRRVYKLNPVTPTCSSLFLAIHSTSSSLFYFRSRFSRGGGTKPYVAEFEAILIRHLINGTCCVCITIFRLRRKKAISSRLFLNCSSHGEISITYEVRPGVWNCQHRPGLRD